MTTLFVTFIATWGTLMAIGIASDLWDYYHDRASRRRATGSTHKARNYLAKF